MFEIGDEISGQYQITDVLRSGKNGGVVGVRDQNDSYFALKYCCSKSSKVQERFCREVTMMATIRHPHVIAILEHNLDHDPRYFLMPLASGSLADEVAELSANEGAALDAFAQACLGVIAIHKADAIHRDIKPSNLLRLDSGVVVVSDLGLAKPRKPSSRQLTRSGMSMGTDQYAAPEQWSGAKNIDQRADVFQLGKTLYALATGQSPGLIDPDRLDPNLAHIVVKATKQVASERYQSVSALLDSITLYQQSRDPNRNPRETLEALIDQARLSMKEGKYESGVMKRILQSLTNPQLPSKAVIDLVDAIPLKVLGVMASNFSEEMVPALKVYAEAVDSEISSYGYYFAENVADAMERVFLKTEHVEVRVLALRTALTAAVRRHRFAAMDTFYDMLIQVPDDEAIAVAEMLMEFKDLYSVVAGTVPDHKLKPAIRRVQEKMIKERKAADGT